MKNKIAFLLCLLLCIPALADGWKWMSYHSVVNLETENIIHFKSPAELDCDDDGNIYFVDVFAAHVTKITPDFKMILAFGRKGQGPGEFNLPYDIAVDGKQKRIWVSDQFGWKIFCYDLTSKLLIQKSVSKHQPFAIAVRSDGKVIVGGSGVTNLVMYDENLELVKHFGHQLAKPMKREARLIHSLNRFMTLTTGPDNEIYVAYCKKPVVECYSANGELLWMTERPWLLKDREPIPAKFNGMSLNRDAETYHYNMFFKDNRLYVAACKDEGAILAFEPTTGKYLGHKKVSHIIRGTAQYKDLVYTLDTGDNSVHIYSKNPISPEMKSLEKDQSFYHKKVFNKNAHIICDKKNKDENASNTFSKCKCKSPCKGKCDCCNN